MQQNSASRTIQNKLVPAWLQHSFILLFFLSGISGLVYEVIWSRYFSLFLGHSAYAQTVILSLFLGGLGVGACACAYNINKIKNPLLVYAFAEITIGLIALSFHFAFEGLYQLYFEQLINFSSQLWVNNIVRYCICALLTIPSAIILGATFPLIASGLRRIEFQHDGQGIASLYFANSLGAVFGIVLTGFVFIELFGLPGSILIAAYINMAVGVTALLLIKTSRLKPAPQKKPPPPASLINTVKNETTDLRFYYYVAFLTGAASLIYELIWIRLLSMVLGSSTHAFEVMLATFIFGIAIGAYFIKSRIKNTQNYSRSLAIIQFAMGFFALLSLSMYNYSYEVMEFALHSIQRNSSGYIIFMVVSSSICALIMLPAAICAGMTLPLITQKTLSQNKLKESNSNEQPIGYIVGVNTFGCIAGIFFAFYFLPILGAKNNLVFAASIDIGIAFILAYRYRLFRYKALQASSLIFTLLTFSFIFTVEIDPLKMASGVFRHGEINTAKKVLFHQDGRSATVSVFDSEKGTRSIATNGKPDASLRNDGNKTGDDITAELLAILPLMYLPNPENFAIIGFGSGRTAHTLLSSPLPKKVDTIEIEPSIVEGAKFFTPHNDLAYQDPRSHIYFDDARSFFSRNHKNKNKNYDVIISEPSNPWVSGVSSLFTQEFFTLAASKLKHQGLLVQWVQLYEIDFSMVASIVASLESVFPYYQVYLANDVDLIILASQSPIASKTLNAPWSWPAMKAILDSSNIKNKSDLQFRNIANNNTLNPLLEMIQPRLNSDFSPILDTQASKSRFLQDKVTVFGEFTVGTSRLLSYPLNKRESLKEDYTAAPFFSASSYIRDALYGYQYFMHKKNETLNLLSDKTRKHVEALSSMQNHCVNKPKQEAWSSSFVYTIKLAVSYLSPEQISELAHKIAETNCPNGLNKQQNYWLNLAVRVAEEDHKNTVMLAKILLGHQHQDYRNSEFLVSLGMISSLKLDNKQASLALFDNYRKQTGKNLLIHNFIASHALHRPEVSLTTVGSE